MIADWIDSFVEQTSSIRSPISFRLWSAIATVASTLERRVWTTTDVSNLYPNLYTVLVGDPASGKTNAVRQAKKTVSSMINYHLGPDNPSKASFMDCVAAANRDTGHLVFHAIHVICEEFGVLFPEYDDSFFADLATLYDNPSTYSSPRRTSTSLSIDNPTVNLLACATPAVLSKFPEAAWGEGFASRVLFIFGVRVTSVRDIFKPREDPDMIALRKPLDKYFELSGKFEWEEDARRAVNDWINDGMPPVPTYSKLNHYNGRRDIQILKLAMISAVSANRDLHVTLNDFHRAKRWLLDAEKTMPDVFKAMALKSDAQVINALHYALWTEYNKVEVKKRQPISNIFVNNFLEERVTSDKIPHLIKQAEFGGYIKRSSFGWVPDSKPSPNGLMK